MNHASTTLRLAATTLAATLAATAMGESRGVSSSESGRSDDSNAPRFQTGIQTGGHLVASHRNVRVHARPSLDSSRRGAGFETARPGRNQGGVNPFEFLELVESGLGFSADDLDAAGPGGRSYLDPIRQMQLAEDTGWDADDLESADGPRQNDLDPGRAFQLAETEAEQQRLQHDPMDIDWNGIVDMQDFGLLIAAFGTADHDLDGDGLVNGKDLGLMLVRMDTLVAVD